MLDHNFKNILALVTSILVFTCTSCLSWNSDPPPVIEVQPPLEATTPSTVPVSELTPLESLNKVAPPGSDNGELVKDLRLILEAQEAEAKENNNEAVTKWRQALEVSSGQFASKALDGWVRTYLKQKETSASIDALSEMILKETNFGNDIPYMKEKKITSFSKISPVIKKVASQWITKEETEEEKAKPDKELIQPPDKDIFAKDPLLIKTAQTYCNATRETKIAWKLWINSLSHGLRLYWAAATAECSKDWLKAEINYKKAIRTLSLSKEYRNFALQSAMQLVQRHRASGKRQDLADAYLQLTKIWGMTGVSGTPFNQTPIQFAEKRIDASLWAARYRAMVGDYENAKQLCQDALDFIAKELKSKQKLSAQNRKNLLEYKAEAYHVLSLRVLVEERNYESAASLSLVALNTIPNMSKEWKDRFEWYLGLYYYLDKHYDKSIDVWTKLLDKPKQSNSVKSKCYYWLARAYQERDMNVEADKYYKLLIDEYPFNFYAIIAAEQQKSTSSGNYLTNLFEVAHTKNSNIITHDDFDLSPFTNENKVARLLRRAEIAIAANLGELTDLAMRELERSTIGRYRLSEKTASSFLYLSRLQVAAGFYHSSISLTSSLIQLFPDFWQRWPEQVYIYFPRPYFSTFKDASSKYSLDIEWPMSVSRQESSFRAKAKSPVGALGLMQIMPATGTQMAKMAKLEIQKIEEALLNAPVNIQLGCLYLSQLQKVYKKNMPAIFAAYNAGEFVVDAWLERRKQKDTMMWIELIPFGETREYVKNVWRNTVIYSYIFNQKELLNILSTELQNNEETLWSKS